MIPTQNTINTHGGPTNIYSNDYLIMDFAQPAADSLSIGYYVQPDVSQLMDTSSIRSQCSMSTVPGDPNSSYFGGIPCHQETPDVSVKPANLIHHAYDIFEPIKNFTPNPQPNLQSQAITITLQYGSQNETVFIERTPNSQILDILRQKARQMVDRYTVKQDNSKKIAAGEILLYLHDYNSATMLQHLTSISQLDNGSVVEIIRIDRSTNERPTRPHCLEVNNYIAPTFCDYCGEILVGLMKQGLQCNLCKCNFHKRCAFAPRNDCAKAEIVPQSSFLTANGMAIVDASCSKQNESAQVNSPQFQLPHTLSFHNYKTPTVCKVCDKMLLGFVKQGLRCRDCKVNVHKKCAPSLPNNCQIIGDDVITPHFDQNTSLNQSTDGEVSLMGPPITTAEGIGLTASTSSTFSLIHPPMNNPATEKLKLDDMSTCSSNEMIPLARLPGSAASRLVRPGPLCEGWMIHFTITPSPDSKVIMENRRLRHYWILTNDAISMYNEYNDGVNPNRVYRQINLAEIIALTPYLGPPINPKHPPHCFEIRTVKNIIYCVGENLDALSVTSNNKNNASKLPNQCSPLCVMNWQSWFKALQQALQPPILRTDPENVEPAVQFTQLYQIFRDKVLGSGQFGTVYFGVHRHNKNEVAIKVIAKDRFSKRTNSGVETLKSEVAILRTIDHHGIIKLENMFETKDKIFVVMEKMNGDMLEMILSQANGRLDERCTKFLIRQILSALRYLHCRGIAHCDLKPENVLLSDFETNFPQTKLCDFGYARFIDDTQFRKTIVGTPAYLAPEVLKRKGYNKSLDMWSVGVIIYVTLSGTFPFNDGEEISDQIHNASFMFPADIWHNISHNAINLIQSLLRVKIEERFTIDECIAHSWLHDEQVYADLRELERRLNIPGYLTSD